MLSNNFKPFLSFKFYCEKCHYGTSKKSNMTNHANSIKHKSMENKLNSNDFKPKLSQDHICQKCNKKYKDNSGLWRHKKKCDIIFNNEKTINEDDEHTTENIKDIIGSNMFFELLKQNNDFKELIIEQNKQIVEQNKMIVDLSTKTTITNNNSNYNNCNNKTFNLQVFLNEKCKDALNITDFVNSLNLSLTDLENVGESGFVNGISKIFIKGLRSLDVFKRPIHCSDLKRETMYLKEQNVWEKDNENKDRLKKVVKLIAHKNFGKLMDWKEKYPECKNSDSKKNDQYMKIICASMGAKTKAEDDELYNKIIRNVAKEVTIDKEL